MISTNRIKLGYKGYMFYVRTIDITLAKRDNVMSISLHRISQEICANKQRCVYFAIHNIAIWHKVIKFEYYFENGIFIRNFAY